MLFLVGFTCGAGFGFLFASHFCGHMRSAAANWPVPDPEPIIHYWPKAAEPAELDDVAEIFQGAGLILVDGKWTAPEAPYNYRRQRGLL